MASAKIAAFLYVLGLVLFRCKSFVIYALCQSPNHALMAGRHASQKHGSIWTARKKVWYHKLYI